MATVPWAEIVWLSGWVNEWVTVPAVPWPAGGVNAWVSAACVPIAWCDRDAREWSAWVTVWAAADPEAVGREALAMDASACDGTDTSTADAAVAEGTDTALVEAMDPVGAEALATDAMDPVCEGTARVCVEADAVCRVAAVGVVRKPVLIETSVPVSVVAALLTDPEGTDTPAVDANEPDGADALAAEAWECDGWDPSADATA